MEKQKDFKKPTEVEEVEDTLKRFEQYSKKEKR